MSFIIQEQASPVLFEIGKEEATGAGGNIDFYLGDQDFLYFEGNASANFSIDLTYDASTTLDDALNVDDLVTITLAAKNGSTPYYLTNFQIDGGAGTVTINWENGGAPTQGSAYEIDYYTFKVLKTSGNTYTVFASTISTQQGVIQDRELILSRGAGSAETIYFARENQLFLQGTALANVTLDLTYATGQELNSVMATGDVYDFNLKLYNAASAFQLTNILVDGDSSIENLYYVGNAPTALPSSVVSYGLELTKIGSASFNCVYSELDLNEPTFFGAFNVQTLIIAGGGGGGRDSSNFGAGGGAGGLLYYGSETPKTPNGAALSIRSGTTLTVTIGGGGAGANTATPSGSSNGTNSSLVGGTINLVATAGGGGGGWAINPFDDVNGKNGGSGGGGTSNGIAGTGIAGQGFAGQGGISTGCGGGGAGASPPAGANSKNGGIGLSYSISGSSVGYAGGGAAANGTATQGGGGGGGTNGTDNTGGGGGGILTGQAGNGGKGIIVLKYPDIYPAATTTGSPTITVAGGFRTYVFNDSGTFTI